MSDSDNPAAMIPAKASAVDAPPTGDALPPDGAAPTIAAQAPTPAMRPGALARRDVFRPALIFLLALALCAIGYLTLTIPGAWFPRAAPKAFGVKDLALVRGAGRVVGDELVVAAPDATGITLVTVTTDFPSSGYSAVAWIVAGLREDADVRLLWHSDVQPNKLNSTPIRVESGRALDTVVAKDRAWLGRITGLALAIHGPLAQPVRIRGVIAKPMGVVGIARDRMSEWFAFEGWSGTSINTIVGGADNQAAPLPAALAAVIALGAVVVLAIGRLRPAAFRVAIPAILAGFFLAGWWLLDARWTFNLIRQESATGERYGGKDARDKHLASEDGPLYAFVEKARAVLPPTPVRIFIAADADYFRGRAAYHLYPHRVFFDPRRNTLPPASALRSGDWLLVYQRHGIQYDRAEGKVRWEGGQTVSAEPKLVEPGAALFVIR